MNQVALVDQLRRLGDLREQEPMSRHTTFGIGGPADFYLRIDHRAAIAQAIAVATDAGLPSLILGSGSNVLVGDEGIRGLVVDNNARETEIAGESEGGFVHLRADSGVSFAALARRLCREGLAGLEWAVGIPGTLGGAVVYNAGAYGGCLADVLLSIDVGTYDGAVHTLSASTLALDYRSSTFTRGLARDHAILSVVLVLHRDEAASLLQHVAMLDVKRKAAQPPGRNAGSIFKNPPEKPAWWYIDQVGLRGARCGDAQVSSKHANFFMNVGQATAADVKTLMEEAVRRVRQQFGIELQAEVGLIGDGFGDEPGDGGHEICSAER